MLFLCCNYKKVAAMVASGDPAVDGFRKKYSFEISTADEVSSRCLQFGFVERILFYISLVIKAEPIGLGDDGSVCVLKMSRSDVRAQNQRELLEESTMMLQMEARTLKFLNDCKIPHICHLLAHDISSKTGQYCLVTQFLGPNESEVERLNEGQACRLFSDIYETLVCMKEVKYLHGDISPANIVMRFDGEFVLIDFGSTRMLEDVAERSKQRFTLNSLRFERSLLYRQSSVTMLKVWRTSCGSC
eukprot:TRINITY_DN5425_c0_g1_i5.p1 TRINITY_DN5425_c0_g1~~TRINITY_DN5425_c0_g1_i5.p1  ORF type:complete len:245 (-),score=37.44 TRINITY_DN5425_c0_g1_i5:666-1400(-)